MITDEKAYIREVDPDFEVCFWEKFSNQLVGYPQGWSRCCAVCVSTTCVINFFIVGTPQLIRFLPAEALDTFVELLGNAVRFLWALLGEVHAAIWLVGGVDRLHQGGSDHSAGAQKSLTEPEEQGRRDLAMRFPFPSTQWRTYAQYVLLQDLPSRLVDCGCWRHVAAG